MTNRLLRLLAAALCLASFNTWAAERDVGIVLMHGKWGNPTSNMSKLARDLEGEGYKVVVPEMPWSGSREYDVSYPQALAEIETAANRLREKGASRIVVAGLSMGANAALAYAASGRPVDAIVVLSPGHIPERGGFRTALEPSVTKARGMVDSGAGKDKAWFDDRNQGRTKQVRVTAESYLSYADPDGLGNMPRSAAAIPRPLPLFMAVGTADSISEVAEDGIFNRAPKHEKSVYTAIASDHIGVAGAISPALIVWLKTLGY